MYFLSAKFPAPPDPALRQPFTTAAFLPLGSCHYLLALLVILPRTFILRLALVPIILWQAWNCAVGLDFSAGLAKWLGRESSERLNHWNFAYVIGMFAIALKSLQWALARKRLRRYERPAEWQHAPVERELSIPNVLLGGFDLLCNQRGIGWSWSRNPFPPTGTRTTTIPSILFKMLFKLVVFDISHYLMQYTRPTLDTPAGDTLFDPTLSIIPRFALATFFTLCAGVVVYTTVDVMYHLATLVGRLVLRQPAWQWPPLSNRPWTATSITDFWSFRWHQFFRHTFIVFGARPGGAMLGRPGALFGAFAVSAVVHDFGIWGLGRGSEFRTAGGFFILMGVGAALEHGFKGLTGRRVCGLWGWAWTMAWTLGWGTLMVDAWARRGLIACDFFPDGLRPGKRLVDAVISFT
ncbi:hypothetical protein BC827DRAFT_1136615 [Russula dissimulans]|nr:hypothetical protein BC827DRAFT_1136615 [Russula dissimulans]